MDDRGELPEAKALDPGLGTAPWHACSTLCLAIALEGWPLVRSQEDWDRSYHMDGGSPEALGYKISVWEAWDRKAGFAASSACSTSAAERRPAGKSGREIASKARRDRSK